MKYIIITLLTIFNIAFACELDYTGTTDSTACLQEMVNNNIQVELEEGTLLITKSIVLHNNINITGIRLSSIIKFKSALPEQAVFRGENVNNVLIANIIIKDDGIFKDSLFPYPYDNNKFAIGFTNLDRGIMILGNSSNIKIVNIIMSGLEIGILIDNKRLDKLNYIDKVTINNNNIIDGGKFGIALFNCQNITINENDIQNIQGNMAYTNISDTKFADGIYLNGVINININNNNINNVKRIGIVLEGRLNSDSDVTNLNDIIFITNNIITDFFGSRGTEYNAGIWAEPATDEKHQHQFKTDNIIIDNNYIDGGFKPHGKHAKWGIVLGAMNSYITHNLILNSDIAMECYFGNILFNKNNFKDNIKDYNFEKSYYLNPIFN